MRDGGWHVTTQQTRSPSTCKEDGPSQDMGASLPLPLCVCFLLSERAFYLFQNLRRSIWRTVYFIEASLLQHQLLQRDLETLILFFILHSQTYQCVRFQTSPSWIRIIRWRQRTKMKQNRIYKSGMVKPDNYGRRNWETVEEEEEDKKRRKKGE